MNSSITLKKTPFQKHHEEEEAMKKRAEDEITRLYAEFVESFQGSDAIGSRTFVRGGTINPNEKLKIDTKGMNSSITRKKTPFQKHHEEEEAMKKRAEDEIARLYAKFVESFQGNDATGSRTFVRGGTIIPNEKLKIDTKGGNFKDGAYVPKKGTRYVPSFLPPSSKARESEKKVG